MSEFKVETMTRDPVITQRVTFVGGPFDGLDLMQDVQTRVINTLDAQAREALIRLGWTPPRPPAPRFNGGRWG